MSWANHKADIVKVKVVDRIRPVSMARWFDMDDVDNPKITEADLSEVDTGACKSMRNLFQNAQSLSRIDGLRNWDTSKVTDMGWFFNGCVRLNDIVDLSGWNTSSCTSMYAMFANCLSLESLDVSRWDTSSCTTMHAMFAADGNQYMKLRTVGDLSGWDTSNVTDMSAMFQGCERLENVGDISGWDTPLCNNFNSMFRGTGMTKTGMKIDVSFVKTWDVRSVTDLSEMFRYCTAQKELNLSGWDISSVKDMSSLFDGMTGLKKISLPASWKWIGSTGTASYLPVPSSSNIPGADGKWYSTTTGIGYAPADIPSGKADIYVASKELLPKVAFAIYSVDDGSLDFYNRAFCDVPAVGDTFAGKTVTDIYTGFETQRFIDTSSNHSNWTSQQPDTPWWSRRLEISSAKVVDTRIRPSSVDYWFYGMENLKTVDVANLDTSSCEDFKMTFGHCGQIETIDLSAWSTASLDNLNGTFLCCLSLSTLDIDGWNTSKVVSFHCLMFDCEKMSSTKMQKVVDNLSVTECANDLGYLFNGCEKLTTIDLSSWNISNVTNYTYMFFACHNLTLDCSHWNVQQDAWHGSFNSYAPGVILPKKWQ